MQGHSPPLARQLADQPHPPWCDGTDGGTCHGSPIAVIGCPITIDGRTVTVPVTAQIIDAGDGTVVFMHGVRLEPRDAKILAHTLALLGHAELAATVKRLADLTDDVLLPAHAGEVMNPTTHLLETLPAVTR